MFNRKTVAALAAGLLCGSLAFGLLIKKASELERRSRSVPVLVATRYLAPNSSLKSDRVEKKRVPEAFVNPGAVSDPSQLEGLVSLVPISAGEQILANKFGRSGGSLSNGLEAGKRAYCLDVTESAGVGGLLKPGDRVDILARYESASRREACFAFQNVLVLAAGRFTGRGENSGERDPDGPYGHVTLSLTAAETEMLTFLEDRAVLKLALRPDGDEEPVMLPPVGEAEVLSRMGRPPKNARPVEIIRGPAGPPKGDLE